MRKLILTIFSEREGLWTCFGFRSIYLVYNVDCDVSYEFMLNDYEGQAQIAPKEASNNA